MQKVKKTMPSQTGIPPDAQAEILQKLSAETKITSCEIAEILKKHDVCGDMDALQDAYWTGWQKLNSIIQFVCTR